MAIQFFKVFNWAWKARGSEFSVVREPLAELRMLNDVTAEWRQGSQCENQGSLEEAVVIAQRGNMVTGLEFLN